MPGQLVNMPRGAGDSSGNRTYPPVRPYQEDMQLSVRGKVFVLPRSLHERMLEFRRMAGNANKNYCAAVQRFHTSGSYQPFRA